jgi:hypothetical protein
MAKIRFMSAPELYADSDGSFKVKADVNVILDDGREIAGFHRDILVSPEGLAGLNDIAEKYGVEAAFAYIVSRIGEANAGYTAARITGAIEAMTLKEGIIGLVTANKLSFPLDVPIAMPKAAQELEARMVAQG